MKAIQTIAARPSVECVSDPPLFTAQQAECQSGDTWRTLAFPPAAVMPLQIDPPSGASTMSHSAARTDVESIPSSQRVAITPVVGKTLNVTVREVMLHRPAANEALVKIICTGICGSDVSFSTGPEAGYPEFDHIAGHEGIGEVVQCHDASLVNHIVAIRYLGATCGICSYCLGGLPTSCPKQLNTPKQIPGTFQQYVAVPVSCLMLLPEQLVTKTPDLAPLCAALCSGSAALMALKAAHISPKSVVVVSGVAGAIGHMAGAMARQVFGARVIGVDYGWKNEILAAEHDREFADILLDAPSSTTGRDWADFKTSLIQSCNRLRQDKGTTRAADCLIICANRVSAFDKMEEYVCDGGHIVCSGVPKGLSLSISIHALVERNLYLTGTLMGGHKASLEVMDYISKGMIRPLITEKALEDIPGSMEDLAGGEAIGKTVVRVADRAPKTLR